ncbi:MAG: hypothetical protein GY722_06090, partial [bacterium]|nr:hypothetical protein [bacterium]
GEALAAALGGSHLTAVGALTRAVREGQPLTRVDAANVDAALAAADLGEDAEASILAGVGSGRIAWIHQSQLLHETWDAAGYVLEDPATGAGGYFGTYERLLTGLDADITFHSPLDTGVVTEPTDVVATIDSEHEITGWTLATRPADGGEARVLASGSGTVTAQTLAQFDPTLLLNGLHDLVLTARDALGQTASAEISVVVDGQMKIGHFTLSYVDLAVPVSGLDIEIIRTYDSRDKQQRDFGIGWSLDIRQGSYVNNRPPGDGWQFSSEFLPCDSIIETKSHLTVVRLSEQEVYRFALQLQNGVPSTGGGCFATARFDFIDGSLPGATLEIIGNDQVFYENGSDRVINVDTFEPYEPENVRLRTRDGRIFELDLQTGVTHLEDPSGNALEISRDGIVHSSGIGINFVRDNEGRIKEIEDLRGFRNLYAYSADSDLISHTDRAGGVTTFTYRPQHLLQEIVNPLGMAAVRTEYDEGGRMIRVIDASGQAIEFEHDLDGRREVVQNQLGFVRILEYDARGNVIRELDELGNETIREFDSRGNVLLMRDPLLRESTFEYHPNSVDLVQVTNAIGQAFSVTYDVKGNPLSFVSPSGTVSFEYDANNRLVRMTDPAGGVSSFQYDSQGNPTREIDPVGNKLVYTYDQEGRLHTAVGSSGASIELDYDAMGNIVQERDVRTAADGSVQTLVTSYVFDALDRIVSTTYPDGAVQSSEFDAARNLVSRADPLGQTTTFAYEPTGRLSSVTYPDSKTEKPSYDAAGRLTSQEDRQGRLTAFSYDAAGRLVVTTFPDGSSIQSVYDAAGQVIETIDELGLTTRIVPDALGRTISTVSPNGSTSTLSYDSQGNLASVTDASGRETEYRYDVLGRVIETILPDDSRSSTEYDLLGREIADVDFAGVRTEYAYDDSSRTLEVKDALGGVTTYSYDEYGNLLARIDAAGKSTLYSYDPRGNRTGRILPDGSAEQFDYNLAGQLVHYIDFNGSTTEFQYDALGRMTERISSDGTASFSYTASGRLATASTGTHVASYEYDLRDRLRRRSTGPGESVDYSRTPEGRLASMSVVVGGVQPLTTMYLYDGDGRLLGIEDPFGGTYSFQYDAAGRKLGEQYPNGTDSTYTYDAVGRLIGKEISSEGIPLKSYSYALEPNGHRLAVVDESSTARRYEYDDLYRLTSERIEDADGALQEITVYGYDAVGNRLFEVRTIQGSSEVLTSYQYDPGDRLSEASTSSSVTSYTWDSNGNRLEQQGDGAAVYSWSPRNELVGIQASGVDVDYGYDALGNLISRTSSDTGADPVEVTTTDWLVDESIPTRRVIAEIDGSAQALRVLYVVEPSSGAPLARFTPNGMNYFHTDGLGSVTGVSDSGGQLASQFSYRPFGKRSPVGGPVFGFTGELQDSRTGLVHLRARWLDPATGSFISMDPFQDTTQPLFAYAANDPINRVDPTGLTGLLDSGLASALATTLSGIQAEGFHIFIAGVEGGQAGVLKAIRTSLGFFALGAAAVPVLMGMIRVARGSKKLPVITGFDGWPSRLQNIKGKRFKSKHHDGLEWPMVGGEVTIANAYVNVSGRKREIVGNSGKHNKALENFLKKEKDIGFGKPEYAPNPGRIEQGNHAERKILELLKKDLDPEDSGTIFLYVDHYLGEGPCKIPGGCADALEEFQKLFKNIQVYVIY